MGNALPIPVSSQARTEMVISALVTEKSRTILNGKPRGGEEGHSGSAIHIVRERIGRGKMKSISNYC